MCQLTQYGLVGAEDSSQFQFVQLYLLLQKNSILLYLGKMEERIPCRCTIFLELPLGYSHY